ncbi:MAG TPA: prolipoprotein diacylglyceryl transferase [Myxococcota bacterium]|nr:prolipoprotein diacylglyceryl transferase [Myxococcota bacterium]HRY93110.1 prolipoprotein diacylglyceryl transferase [Myxococcota bacterium]HSA20358.1 prolipoprotein diacylglyceryl transferase [Myxococcota bacterium]
MRPWLFAFGELRVPSYWAFLMIGLMAAFYLAWREARRDGLDGNRFLDLCLLMLLTGILGARLMHVLAEDNPLAPGEPILTYYLAHPLDIFKLWNGLAYYGALLLSLPVALWFTRRPGLGVGRTFDLIGVFMPLGLTFGRLGCLLAGCCHGTPSGAGWGVVFDDPASLARPLGVPLHPTQLYEAGVALLLFGLLWVQKRRWRRFEGQVFLSFLALYSSARFLLEFLRGDNRGAWFGGALSSSQVISIPLLLAALTGLVWLQRRAARRARSAPG